MSAITALTAQNTVGVQGIFEVSPEFVAQQIDSVMSDIGADAWKTGMLSNAEIISVVAHKTKAYEMEKLVVDPVMVAKSGDSLLRKEAQDTLINLLLPLSYIITPNHHEAEVLTGLEINNLKGAEKAAVRIHQMGAKNVVVKGGHIPGISDAIDVLYDGNQIKHISSPRIDSENTHGTGCTYASAIAAEVAKGKDFINAVKIAKEYLTKAIKNAVDLNIGKGHGPLNHFYE
jgi:hydroxymethylpyrimidine/phosphomethylpyrimidine kinase